MIQRCLQKSDERAQDGFTLLEVLLAAGVLLLAITSSIVALQRGIQSLDTARNLTYASQVMQSEIERLRLKNWSQIQDLENSGDTAVSATAVVGTAATSFACTREIRDLKTDMKQITLTSSWRGCDGQPRSAKLITRYGKSGLYDYFYTSY